MKYTILGIAVIAMSASISAHAGYSTSGSCDIQDSCPTANCTQLGVVSDPGCVGYNTLYIGSYKYGYCGSCANGYYEETNNRVVPGTSCRLTFTSCSGCPSPGQMASGGNKITSCYIPAWNTFSDNTGAGQYTGNCYYTL